MLYSRKVIRKELTHEKLLEKNSQKCTFNKKCWLLELVTFSFSYIHKLLHILFLILFPLFMSSTRYVQLTQQLRVSCIHLPLCTKCSTMKPYKCDKGGTLLITPLLWTPFTFINVASVITWRDMILNGLNIFFNICSKKPKPV